ncbi:MAG: carbon-nitrogen hydrolase family protein [Cyclobacteriaceae bacterium]
MKIAIIQHAPKYLDIRGSIDKAINLIVTASQNAELIVFGETWFSGYPAWLDYCPEIGLWDHPPMKKIFARMLENALELDGEHLMLLKQCAADNNVNLIFGANEVDRKRAKGTVYNSLFFVSNKGEILNHHRKLVPTYTEKLLYGYGDGHGLNSVSMSGNNVTGAICWEHWMPLTRQSLHNAGEDIHVAVWPKVHEMHQIASRQYAFEGRCFVIAAGQMLKVSDFPAELQVPADLNPDQYVLNGGSCVITPNGQYLVDPVFDLETIVYADLDLDQVREESLLMDVSGHYQRDDVFTFEVNNQR